MSIKKPNRVIVYGESLIDLVDNGNGRYTSLPGGSPYNVARALGLQNITTSYICPLSTDAMGIRLRDTLAKAGVQTPAPPSPCPTSLALVSLDAKQQPLYSLYRTAVADRDISLDTLKTLVTIETAIFFCGSLVFIPDEINKTKALLIHTSKLKPSPLICIDLNMRPMAVNNPAAYSQAVQQIIPQADIVKLSDEDLQALPFGTNPQTAAKAIAKQMSNGAVIITQGAQGCIVHAQGQSQALKPPQTIKVIDTIGAGDCFQAGLIAWLHDNKIHTSQALKNLTKQNWQDCLNHASLCAAINLSRQGCQPPTRQEIKETHPTQTNHTQ